MGEAGVRRRQRGVTELALHDRHGNATHNEQREHKLLTEHKHCVYVVRVLMNLITLLQDAGVRVEVGDKPGDRGTPADHVLVLALDESTVRLAVEIRQRAPYPNEIAGLSDRRAGLTSVGIPTLVAPYVSDRTGKQLTDAGWSWGDDFGNADLRAPGLRIRQRTGARPEMETADRLPQGFGSLAIVRYLITTGECPGPTALSEIAGVSQPRASQVLGRLRRAGLVDKTGPSTWSADRSALLAAFLSQYRGPRGSERLLYTLDPLETAATRISELSRRESGAAVALSGDIAADRIAPWRTPTTLLVYAPEPFSTDPLNMIEATGRQDANVIVRYPQDASVFGFEPLIVAGLRVVDPTQVIWDLNDHNGSDRREAGERVASWLLSH